MSTDKRLLIVCRKAPYGSSISREALDVALAAALFNQQLALVFIGDGVWQLLQQQQSEAIAIKNQQKLCSALPLYEVNDIYVDQDAMKLRSISSADLSVKATISSPAAIARLMQQSDVIFNF